jgi:hypothetical protein
MRLNRPARLRAALVSGALLTALSLSASARQKDVLSLFLYKGESEATSAMRLASWGSGRAEFTRDNILNGDSAIKVTTHGLYQGARFDFKQPIDLTSALGNKAAFLRMMVRFPGSQQSSFDAGSFQSSQVAAAPFERMRYLAIMTDGKQIELNRPVDIPPSEDVDAYVPISFPLAALTKSAGKSLSGDGAKLKSLVVAGDKYGQFNIGEIGIITDETDISIAPLEDQIVFPNQDITFTGNAEGGSSTLKFSWDWDDKDGVQEDSVGRTANHSFKKTGKYTVTLTVSDVDGVKKPQTSKIELDVQQ